LMPMVVSPQRQTIHFLVVPQYHSLLLTNLF